MHGNGQAPAPLPLMADRLDKASWELYSLMRNDTTDSILGRTWQQHHHVFGGAASTAPASPGSLNFDTEAMRLAAGGQAARTSCSGSLAAHATHCQMIRSGYYRSPVPQVPMRSRRRVRFRPN